MKSIKLILVVALAFVGFTAVAQELNYDDPKYAKWGSNAEERKEMMLTAQFLKEAVDNRNYNLASGYLKVLLEKAPAGYEKNLNADNYINTHSQYSRKFEDKYYLDPIPQDEIILYKDKGIDLTQNAGW